MRSVNFEESLPQHLQDLDPRKTWGSGTAVVLDFETTTKNFGDPTDLENHIVLAVWFIVDLETRKILAEKFIEGDEYEMQPLVEDILAAEGRVIAQNAKFELGWLARCGMSLHPAVPWCTMMFRRVMAGNSQVPLDLNSLAVEAGFPGKEDRVNKMIKGGLAIEDISPRMLKQYCYVDVLRTYQVWDKQAETAQEDRRFHTFFTRMILTPCLADIEANGMALDAARVREEHKLLTTQKQELELVLEEMTGGINMRSTDQVAEFLYGELGFKELTKGRAKTPVRGAVSKRWPEGKPKVDQVTIAKLKPTNKKQREFLRLRKELSAVDARLNKAIKTFMACITDAEEENRVPVLKFNFNQHVTKTHRLSSNGKNYSVQGQNIPRVYKRLFCAKNPTYVMTECDFSQLEFQVAGFLTQDPQALEDVATKFDVHRYSAAVMKNGGMEGAEDLMEEVTKDERTAAKAATFGPLFGKTSGTKEEVAYFEAFRKKYGVMTKVQEGWISEVLRHPRKALETVTGFTFYFPKAKMNQDGFVTDNTNIRNYPIQSFATAEIVPVAVTYLWHALRIHGLDTTLVNTIHDSMVLEGPEEEAKEIIEEIAPYCGTDMVYKYLDKIYDVQYTSKLELEGEYHTHWGK